MMHEAVFAGFGGQGVLLIGRMLTYAGMLAGKEISFMPAYGPEMRGGTASCSVVISDETIGSPVVTKPSILIAMNKPSLDKFEPAVQPDGIIIVNSSIVERTVERDDLKVYYVPMNEMATKKLGNARYSNMIALGALIGITDIVALDYFQDAFAKSFAAKPDLVEVNMRALKCGIEFVAKNGSLA